MHAQTGQDLAGPPEDGICTPLIFSILSHVRMIANIRLWHLSQNEQDPAGDARWMEYYRNRGYMVQQPECEE